MQIRARVTNTVSAHAVEVSTDDRQQHLAISAKASGRGSAVNGGELLFAALATCYCNDLFREAATRNLRVDEVDVEVSGEFGGPGEPARNVVYRVRVRSDASQDAIDALVRETDAVAEIHNTLRGGCSVTLIRSSSKQ